MTSINSIGGASGGGMNPDVNRPKTPEEREAKAKQKEEQNRAKKNVKQGVEERREQLRGFWTDKNGQEHVEIDA